MKDELIELLTVATTGKGVVEGIEIAHSAFPSSLYLTPAYPGFDAVHEDNLTYVYEYVPLSVQKATKQNDLSQEYSFTIQDLNEVVGTVLDLIPIDSDERPAVILRTFVYREDGSVSDIQDGPYSLEAGDISGTIKGSTFTATPPITNYTGTGESYSFTRFPSLLAYST